MIVFKVILWWFVILVLAIFNGFFREKFLVPDLGAFAAYIISGISLSALVLLVVLLAVPGFAPLSFSRCVIIGLCWLAMTLIFEFTFGLYVQHKTLTELFDAYRFSGGNIWPIVLLCIVVAPLLAAHIRRH